MNGCAQEARPLKRTGASQVITYAAADLAATLG